MTLLTATLSLALTLSATCVRAQQPVARASVPDVGATVRRLDAFVDNAPLDAELEIGLGLVKLELRKQLGVAWLDLAELMDGAELEIAFDAGRSDRIALAIRLPNESRTEKASRQLERLCERTGLRLEKNVLVLGEAPRSDAAALTGVEDGERADLVLTVDTERLRQGSIPDRPDPFGSFLISTVMPLIESARFAELELRIGASDIQVQGRFDSTATAIAPWRGLIGHGEEGYAPPPAPPGTALALSLDRDLHGLFTQVEQLFDEAEQLELSTGISQIETLMGKGSLVDDVLPQIGAPWTLFVTAPPPVEPPATIGDSPTTLPGFALVVPSGKGAHSLLQRTFQVLTIVTFQERRRDDQLPFSSHRRADEQGVTQMTAEPRPWRGPNPTPVEGQLVPTLTQVGGFSILASHRSLARQIGDSIRNDGPQRQVTGDRLELSLEPIVAWLREHESLLATNEVLDKGLTFEKAIEDQLAFRKLLGLFERLGLALEPRADHTALFLDLQLRRGGKR